MDVSVIRDLLAVLLSASLAHALVKALEFSASRDYLTQVVNNVDYVAVQNKLFALFRQRPTRCLQLVCRKIVHISTGPLFVLTWPLFR